MMFEEKMVFVYDDVHNIPGVCLRITNTYGPRHQMAHDEYGVLNWFIRKAIDDEVVPVFGDGRFLRDVLYVDDRVDCFLQVASCDQAYGEVFNVGSEVPISLIELAKKIVEIARGERSPLPNLHRREKRWSQEIIIQISQRLSVWWVGGPRPTWRKDFQQRSNFTENSGKNTGSKHIADFKFSISDWKKEISVVGIYNLKFAI